MAEYIERGSAEAIFRNARRRMNPEMYKTFDEFNTRDCMLLNAEQLIHLLPAADVVPVRHGRWIWTETGEEDYEQYWVCSSCGGKCYWQSKFCSECGARMDGDGDV